MENPENVKFEKVASKPEFFGKIHNYIKEHGRAMKGCEYCKCLERDTTFYAEITSFKPKLDFRYFAGMLFCTKYVNLQLCCRPRCENG